MKTSQKGFTLIELIVVIVLLGILGVTALGKFQDLSTDAQTAANAGIASEVAAGAALNYAARQLAASNPNTVAVTGTVTCSTAFVSNFLSVALNASNFSVTDGADVVCSGGGDTVQCSIAENPSIGATAATSQIICTN